MAQMKLIPADDMKDKLWGKRGTPEREEMEAKLKEDVKGQSGNPVEISSRLNVSAVSVNEERKCTVKQE